MWYKNIKGQNLLILILSTLGLGSSLYFVGIKPTLNSEEKLQIEKTVLSGVFHQIINHPDENPDYFFISVSNTNPSQELIDAFKTQSPAVEPISAALMTFGFSAPVVHKNDRNKKGIIVDLKEPTATADGNVTVITSIYKNRGSTANYVFILTKKEDEFKVVSVQFPEKKQTYRLFLSEKNS